MCERVCVCVCAHGSNLACSSSAGPTALALGSVWSLQAKAEPSETRSQIDDTTSTGNATQRQRKPESWVNSLQTNAPSWWNVTFRLVFSQLWHWMLHMQIFRCYPWTCERWRDVTVMTTAPPICCSSAPQRPRAANPQACVIKCIKPCARWWRMLIILLSLFTLLVHMAWGSCARLAFFLLMLCVSEKLKRNDFWLKWKEKIGDKHWPETKTANSEEGGVQAVSVYI